MRLNSDCIEKAMIASSLNTRRIHAKDRAGYRKVDGTYFHGPRHGMNLYPRHCWMNAKKRNVFYNNDYGWRSFQCDIDDSVDDCTVITERLLKYENDLLVLAAWAEAA